MIKSLIVALVLCIIEFLVIVLASPLAKPSLVLRFLPEDVRETAKNHPEPAKTDECTGWKNRSFNNKNQIVRIIAYPFLSMFLAGVFILIF